MCIEDDSSRGRPRDLDMLCSVGVCMARAILGGLPDRDGGGKALE